MRYRFVLFVFLLLVGVASASSLTSNANSVAGAGISTGDTVLTLALNGDLTGERVLTAGLALAFVDAGAESTLTINFKYTATLAGNQL